MAEARDASPELLRFCWNAAYDEPEVQALVARHVNAPSDIAKLARDSKSVEVLVNYLRNPNRTSRDIEPVFAKVRELSSFVSANSAKLLCQKKLPAGIKRELLEGASTRALHHLIYSDLDLDFEQRKEIASYLLDNKSPHFLKELYPEFIPPLRGSLAMMSANAEVFFNNDWVSPEITETFGQDLVAKLNTQELKIFIEAALNLKSAKVLFVRGLYDVITQLEIVLDTNEFLELVARVADWAYDVKFIENRFDAKNLSLVLRIRYGLAFRIALDQEVFDTLEATPPPERLAPREACNVLLDARASQKSAFKALKSLDFYSFTELLKAFPTRVYELLPAVVLHASHPKNFTWLLVVDDLLEASGLRGSCYQKVFELLDELTLGKSNTRTEFESLVLEDVARGSAPLTLCKFLHISPSTFKFPAKRSTMSECAPNQMHPILRYIIAETGPESQELQVVMSLITTADGTMQSLLAQALATCS